jgi:hypothetical protein
MPEGISTIAEVKIEAAISALTVRIDAMEKALNTLTADMKDYQTKITHQTRVDYDYIDQKIDRRTSEVEAIARESLSYIKEHIVLTQAAELNKKGTAEWVKWMLPVIVTVAIAAIQIVKV